MEKIDLPDVSFEGIPEDYLRDVPVETQRRVTEAFPEIRVLWNAKIWKMQLVCVAETILTPYYDGQVLKGWVIIPGDIPQSKGADGIIEDLRRREHFNKVRLKEMGYADMNAYLDDVMPAINREFTKRAMEMAEQTDREFERGLTNHNGILMSHERSRDLSMRDWVAAMDRVDPNRHRRTGRKQFSLTSGGRKNYTLTSGGVILEGG